jgi:hypothetical protein
MWLRLIVIEVPSLSFCAQPIVESLRHMLELILMFEIDLLVVIFIHGITQIII